MRTTRELNARASTGRLVIRSGERSVLVLESRAMSMPPPGHPAHPEMQPLYGGGYAPPPRGGIVQPDPQAARIAQATVDELLAILSELVAAGDPPHSARHSTKVGAPR